MVSGNHTERGQNCSPKDDAPGAFFQCPCALVAWRVLNAGVWHGSGAVQEKTSKAKNQGAQCGLGVVHCRLKVSLSP